MQANGRMKWAFLLAAALVTAVGCATRIPEGERLDFTHSRGLIGLSNCYNFPEFSEPMVWRNQTEFDQWEHCLVKSPEWVEVDFSEQNLIGIVFRGSGCDYRGSQVTHIIQDDARERIVILIETDSSGDCPSLHQVGAVFITPVIPEGYSVVTIDSTR
jgi:hypothetical protein